MKLLVCGGAGFIGSNFVRQRVLESGDEVVVYDKLTYAGREENLEGIGARLIVAGIEDRDTMLSTVQEGFDAVVNFAAETHVDRSIQEPDAFVKTHALGTYSVVEVCRQTGTPLVQISTDEVQFEEGIQRTVEWYVDRQDWWGPLLDADYMADYERQYGAWLAG